MKRPRALSLAVCFGFMLIAGLWVAPAKLTAASTTSSIVGTWEGTVDPGAQAKKTVVLHISVGQDGIISGTIDYPDQDTSGIEITAITYQQHALHMESTPGLVSYDGTMNEEASQLTGTWTQSGNKLALVLKRTR
ncbi:MAG: hypothetical protein WAL58_06860 [Terriglobales bacterium]